MKLFKILLIGIFILSHQNLFSQSNLSKENQAIADDFIKKENYLIVNQEFISEKEKLVFKEFRKFNVSEIEKLKVTFPKYLMVDTKTKPGKEIKQVIKSETVYSDLQFDFTDAPFVVFINSETSIDNKFYYQEYRFSDLIVAKYVTEKSNEVFYICKLNITRDFRDSDGRPKRETFIEYGIFTEADLNATNKQKNYDFVINGNESLNLEDIKTDAKKYLKGYFSNIFPDNEIYLYDVVYDINIVGSEQKAKFVTTAISNTKENKLNIEDFYSTEKHKPIEFKYKSSINIYKLLSNPIIIDSITGIKNLQNSAFRYWDQEDQDIRINNEVKLMKQNLSNFAKFNTTYFTNKFKDLSYFGNIEKKPYILKVKKEDERGNEIGFEFNQYIQEGNYDIGRVNHGAKLSIETNETKVIFKYMPQEMGNYVNDDFNFTPKSITKEFDTRLDSLDFKFVFVDPLLLMNVDYDRQDYHYQKDVTNLIDFNAKYCSQTLKEYYDYLQTNNKQKSIDNKNKEILYSKYGKKYVDLALEGQMVVGMPEDLLVITMNVWEITRRTNFQNGYGWDCYSKLDKSKKLTLRVTNKKVSYVSYY
jgi:hypothetical protein